MGRISPGPTRWPPGAERRLVPAKSNLKPQTTEFRHSQPLERPAKGSVCGQGTWQERRSNHGEPRGRAGPAQDVQERRKVAPRSHWEGLSPKISGILEKAKAHRVPKKAAEEPKPLSFATPNPWSALPREVYVGKGRGKKEGATTESPVDGQDHPRMYLDTTEGYKTTIGSTSLLIQRRIGLGHTCIILHINMICERSFRCRLFLSSVPRCRVVGAGEFLGLCLRVSLFVLLRSLGCPVCRAQGHHWAIRC